MKGRVQSRNVCSRHGFRAGLPLVQCEQRAGTVTECLLSFLCPTYLREGLVLSMPYVHSLTTRLAQVFRHSGFEPGVFAAWKIVVLSLLLRSSCAAATNWGLLRESSCLAPPWDGARLAFARQGCSVETAVLPVGVRFPVRPQRGWVRPEVLRSRAPGRSELPVRP